MHCVLMMLKCLYWKANDFCCGKRLRHAPHPPHNKALCSFSRDALLGNFISCSSVVSPALCTRCSSQPNRVQITTSIQLWAAHWARAISQHYCVCFSASLVCDWTNALPPNQRKETFALNLRSHSLNMPWNTVDHLMYSLFLEGSRVFQWLTLWFVENTPV